MKFTYKNTSNQTQNLVGFGIVEPGQTVDTDERIINPSFQLVSRDGSAPTPENITPVKKEESENKENKQ